MRARHPLTSQQTLRSARSHLGRLKALVAALSALSLSDRQALVHHLNNIERALPIIARGEQGDEHEAENFVSARQQGRNPAHFQSNGRNLSPLGQRAIDELYDLGYSIRSAAREIGISASSAGDHRARWLKKSINPPVDCSEVDVNAVPDPAQSRRPSRFIAQSGDIDFLT